MRIVCFEIKWVGFGKDIDRLIKAEFAKTNDFVRCVKLYREKTGSFLMVSKKEVERILNYNR